MSTVNPQFNDNFVPRDFFDLSKEIENSVSQNNDISRNSKDAAWLRAAISRAYYAIFLSLKQEFISNPSLRTRINNNAGDHRRIKDELQNLPSNLFYLAGFFEDLRDYRNNADYDLPPTYEVDPNDANTATTKASIMLSKLSDIIQNI